MTKFRETIGVLSLVVFASSLAYGQLHTSEQLNGRAGVEVRDDYRVQRKALGHLGGKIETEADGKIDTTTPGEFETKIELDSNVKLDARTDNQVGFPEPDSK